MAASPPLSPAEVQAQVASLRAVFAALVTPAMARYLELVGSSMVWPLQLDLNEVAQTNAWHIRFKPSGLEDNQAFETAAAVRAYRILTRTLINHMTIVIGARLAKSILRDIVQQLEPAQRQVVERYHLVPDTTLFGLDQ